MLELRGKYNTTKVFTDNVDNETISQVIELLNQDYIKDAKIRIMPDCHAGTGCVIGTTMTISDKVCPNLVGVDIGCGMLAVRIAEKDVDLPKLDDVINTYVPAGFNVNDEPLGNFSHLNDLVAPANISLAYCSIGSLGGGNHFIELDKDDDDEFRESMKGIYSSSVMESTIDESPMVYKPMEEIMENIKDTVDIVKVIKPVYNFKAH